jgi:putative CocE/NonD family hydrolase
MNWETPNPEWWVARGYAVVRVDQRGAGASPGRLDLFASPTQGRDFYDAIEWAAGRPWSTGKVGLLGISYYAITQWQVAALQPPHLRAMIPWEGFVDLYRDALRHGGIYCNGFVESWYQRQISPVQHGVHAGHSREELLANRVDLLAGAPAHPLDDDFYAAFTPDLSKIEVPLLSVGNWGGLGLHLRGNIEGFLQTGSAHKWLKLAIRTGQQVAWRGGARVAAGLHGVDSALPARSAPKAQSAGAARRQQRQLRDHRRLRYLRDRTIRIGHRIHWTDLFAGVGVIVE